MTLKVKNVNINGDDTAVTLAIKPINTRKKNQEHIDCEDSYSKKGKQSRIISWLEISNNDK